MALNSHYALPLAAVGLGSIEVAASNGATPAHFLAAGAVITSIVGVVKGWDWVQHKMKETVAEGLALHNLEDQRRHDLVAAQVERLAGELERRPCIAGKCRNRDA